MKVSHYAINHPVDGISKQYCIIAREYRSSSYVPIVYLQRPKWIKDDSQWDKICNSIILRIPKNYEIGEEN